MLPLQAAAAARQQPIVPFPDDDEAWPPPGWVSDIPLVDLTGTWGFDPQASDPMIEIWRDKKVSYRIDQQSSFIVLEFLVGEGQTSQQRYLWNGTVHRFQRGAADVEEMARWSAAGRTLEVIGRGWDRDAPDEINYYSLRYVTRGRQLTFVQENDTGKTVWVFDRERD